MSWIDVIRKTIKYIEDNLLSIENIDEVASDMYISSFYLQKGFKLMTGYSISEYIRNRRLYLSALELMKSEDKIIIENDKTTNDLSDAISKDLIKRGMKFVGSTIIYSYLQAIGVIYSHDEDCFLYKANSILNTMKK